MMTKHLKAYKKRHTHTYSHNLIAETTKLNWNLRNSKKIPTAYDSNYLIAICIFLSTCRVNNYLLWLSSENLSVILFSFFPVFFTRPYIRSIWNNFKNKHFMNGNGSLWTHLVFVIASVFNGRKKRTHTHTHAEVNYIPLCKSINKNKMSCNLYENETTARLKTSKAQLTAIKMPFWKWKINTFLIITHLLS